MYLQSLIYLGLVLFLLTILINGLARLVIVALHRRDGGIRKQWLVASGEWLALSRQLKE